MRTITTTARLRGGVAAVSAVLAATAATALAPPATAVRAERAATGSTVRLHRGGHDATIRFHRSRAGEAFVTMTVSARGVSWAERRNESAVVSAYVDGRYATDVVIMSASPVTRQFALGHLKVGRHTLRLHYAAKRSLSKAGVATLRDIRFTTVPPGNVGYAAARYAPVLYGRNLSSFGGPYENNRTDTPLLAWHQSLPAALPGHRIIEYSVVWSNEDGGTSDPGLMGRWGRTTDIEWIYRVEVDARGRRVPGTGVFQSPAHATEPFHGRYAGTHPLLQTCTSNNNVCQKIDDPMRFALSTRGGLPAGQPREYVMVTHPWTYRVMAQEMVREGKIESPSDPLTPAVGDQRSYLYLSLTHTTQPPASAGGMGLAVDVRLVGDPTTYTSDHDIPAFTVNRDGPASTTVELPVGTTPADVASVAVRRVPILADDGATLAVTRVERAFFLGPGYLPRPSFLHWHGLVTLSTATPTAVLWTAS